MDKNDEGYRELEKQIADLTARIYKLEKRAGVQSPDLPSATPRKPAATPDLEAEIGGHWLNRAGIVAVLIGVSYFLKYAFDNAWVGSAGRVSIGLVGGLAVLYWSESIRRNGYDVFSCSLKAVGIGVLYLSLWASSQLYALVPPGLVFFGMCVVSASTVAMALLLDSEVIAAFAAVGAFITPVALSTGENAAVSLFVYLTIVDAGVLVLMRYRAWTNILVGSFAGTLILFGGWHNRFYTPNQFDIALAATSVFFAIFLAAPLLLRSYRDALGVSSVTLANAGAYVLWVRHLFTSTGSPGTAALAAVVLGAIYFGLGRLASPVHWTIGISLLIVAVPMGLDGQWITLGCLAQAAGLAWISRRAKAGYFAALGLIALVLGVARILLVDRYELTRLVFNERMFMFVAAIAAIGAVAWVFSQSTNKEEVGLVPLFIVSINILALVALSHELNDAWQGIALAFAYSALWMCYGAGLLILGFGTSSRFLRWQALILIGFTIAKVFVYDIVKLDRGYRIVSLIALGLLLLATSFFYQRDWFKLKGGNEP